MEYQHVQDNPNHIPHNCLIAVDERGDSFLIKSEPSLYENDTFDGNSLADNIHKNTDNIPKECGVYECVIIVHAYSYWTECGTEYEVDCWIENAKKII
jgi:hypothetical protein